MSSRRPYSAFLLIGFFCCPSVIACLWDFDTLEPLSGAPLRAPDPPQRGAVGWNRLWSVAVDADAQLLAAGGTGVLAVWDVDPDSWRSWAERIVGRSLTAEERRVFVGESSDGESGEEPDRPS